MTSFESLRELLMRDRSVRRFDASRPVSHDTLVQLVELTRYCASARNAQPLRYRAVTAPSELSALFPSLAWAGYLTEWPGPGDDERPTAYLVQCLDTAIASSCACDDGLQLQAITLGAAALGIAGCIIKAFNGKEVAEALDLDKRYTPLHVLALGYPAEHVKIVDMADPVAIRYYREADGTHCVPKRPLDSLLIPASGGTTL